MLSLEVQTSVIIVVRTPHTSSNDKDDRESTKSQSEHKKGPVVVASSGPTSRWPRRRLRIIIRWQLFYIFSALLPFSLSLSLSIHLSLRPVRLRNHVYFRTDLIRRTLTARFRFWKKKQIPVRYILPRGAHDNDNNNYNSNDNHNNEARVCEEIIYVFSTDDVATRRHSPSRAHHTNNTRDAADRNGPMSVNIHTYTNAVYIGNRRVSILIIRDAATVAPVEIVL